MHGIIKADIQLDEHFPFNIYNKKIPPGNNMDSIYHWHECLEISYVKSGKGRYYINDRIFEMKPGDIIVINNIEPHYLEVYEEEMEQPVIVFDPSLVLSTYKPSYEFDYLSPFFERGTNFNNKIEKSHPMYSLIMQNILDIEKEYIEKPESYTLMIIGKLFTLLTLFIRYFREDMKVNKNRRINIIRIEKAIKFIEENFKDDLKLEKVASIIHISPEYFSSLFKKTIGINFSDFIMRTRINYSINLLKSTDMKITNISLDSGFNSSVNYNLAFKKITGKTPSEFRR